jgi:hypothetical protein
MGRRSAIPEFRPAQRMGAGQPVLAAAHMQQALPKIQLLASQTTSSETRSPCRYAGVHQVDAVCTACDSRVCLYLQTIIEPNSKSICGGSAFVVGPIPIQSFGAGDD